MQKEQVPMAPLLKKIQRLGNLSSTLAHALAFPTYTQVHVPSCQISVLED